MIEELDVKVSKLTVRLKDVVDDKYIGTGILYYVDELKENVYVITASHCLFNDGDRFQEQREEVYIDVLEENSKEYRSIKAIVNPNLLFKETTKDIAILTIDKIDVENILGDIPKVKVVKEKSFYKNFIVKGFPQATLGQEIAVLYPEWLQKIDSRFQLQLKEDYSSYNTKGFSGSGVFINTPNDVFLYGVFTRFRAEEKGNVIYSQFLYSINELLIKNHLPVINIDYFGGYGLTEDFFKKHIEKSIVGLGPRFSENLNFQLPIAKAFNDVAKDDFFKKQLYKIFDDWLLKYGYKKANDNSSILEIENDYESIKEDALNWIKELDVSIENKIDIDWLLNKLEELNSKIDRKSEELYELRRENKDSSLEVKVENTYVSALSRLEEIKRHIEDFIFDITKNINIRLSNNPYLIIKGDAGNGKSHLLGDITKKRINRNLPTLLLLGQNFLSSKNIWENIKSELSLDCSDKELLIELNNIGKQIGSRVLILIDAMYPSEQVHLVS